MSYIIQDHCKDTSPNKKANMDNLVRYIWKARQKDTQLVFLWTGFMRILYVKGRGRLKNYVFQPRGQTKLNY